MTTLHEENTPQTITLDARNRANLNGFELASKTFYVHPQSDGTLILEPAEVMSATQAAYLRDSAIRRAHEEALAQPIETLHGRTPRRERRGR